MASAAVPIAPLLRRCAVRPLPRVRPASRGPRRDCAREYLPLENAEARATTATCQPPRSTRRCGRRSPTRSCRSRTRTSRSRRTLGRRSMRRTRREALTRSRRRSGLRRTGSHAGCIDTTTTDAATPAPSAMRAQSVLVRSGARPGGCDGAVEKSSVDRVGTG